MSASPRLFGYEGSLSVVTSLCLTYTFLIIGARVYIRYRSYGVEDAFVLVATLVILSNFGIGYACIHDGLGKPYHMIQDSLADLNSVSIAGVITFILSIYLSKIGTLLFMLRIGSIMRSRPFYYACIALCAIFCLVSILVVTVDCPIATGYYWDFAGNIKQCPTQLKRWKAMLILDLISEAGLLILPFQLVWSLQMPQGTKAVVVSIFWTRAPVIALSVTRHHYVQQLLRLTSDKSLVSALVVILMEVQATYTLASCTLATARNFTDGFSTGWGMADMRGAAEEYNLSNLGSSSAGRSTRRATITTEKSKNRKRSSTLDLASRSEAKAFNQTHGEKRRRRASAVGIMGGEEDEMHILKHTEYTVSHEEASNLSRFRDSV